MRNGCNKSGFLIFFWWSFWCPWPRMSILQICFSSRSVGRIFLRKETCKSFFQAQDLLLLRVIYIGMQTVQRVLFEKKYQSRVFDRPIQSNCLIYCYSICITYTWSCISGVTSFNLALSHIITRPSNKLTTLNFSFTKLSHSGQKERLYIRIISCNILIRAANGLKRCHMTSDFVSSGSEKSMKWQAPSLI